MKIIGDYCENFIVEYLKLGKFEVDFKLVKLVVLEKKGWDIEYKMVDGIWRFFEIKGIIFLYMENFEFIR